MLMRLAFHLLRGESVVGCPCGCQGQPVGGLPITRLDKYWSRDLYRPSAIQLSSQDGVGFIKEA